MFKHRLAIVVRWIVLVPVAYAAALLFQLIVIVGNNLTMARHIDPNSFLFNAWILFISTVSFSGTLVYVSSYIAPWGKKAVSIVTATLATALAVGLCFLAVLENDVESVFHSIFFAIGAIGVSASIVSGDAATSRELSWHELPDHAAGKNYGDLEM